MAGEARLLQTPPWKQGEDAALALRHRLGLGAQPVNVYETIRDLGIVLALHGFGPEGPDGMYIVKSGEPLIIVNTDRRASVQRFTAAHELGHHELHRHEAGDLVIGDEEVGRSSSADDPAETAANSFAAHFLAPAAAIAHELGGRSHGDISFEDVIELMRTFGMSYRATLRQLQWTQRINPAEHARLIASGENRIEDTLRQRGIVEDATFPSGEPLPGDYIQTAVRLWQERIISPARLAEMLQMTAEDTSAWLKQRGFEQTPEPDRSADVDALLADLGL